jgi:hypothetical protein
MFFLSINIGSMLNYNNPGNIEKQVGTIWKGSIIPGDSTRFVTFQTPGYGYRALFKVLITNLYQGNNTVSGIITEYAPSGDGNNTANYINFITNTTGIPPNEVISLQESDKIYRLAYAIARFETGTTPVTSDIQEGFNLAFGDLPVPSAQFPSVSVANVARNALLTGALLLFLSED